MRSARLLSRFALSMVVFLLVGSGPLRPEPQARPQSVPDEDQDPHITKAHDGWRQTLCFDCHEARTMTEVHEGTSYRLPECGSCHGYNGAPHEDHAIPVNPCGTCHAAVDHFASFEAPGDCMGCHLHPESPKGK